MSRRKSSDASEEGGLRVFVTLPEEEIANGLFIQPVGNRRVKTNTVQRVADDQAIPGLGVIERLYPEMISTAKQTPPSLVPDGESEVADQVVDAILTPGMIGAENQLDISGVFKLAMASGFELVYEIVSTVDSGIGDDPNVVIQAEWLPLAQRLIRRTQHRVAQTAPTINPGLLRVGGAESHVLSHAP